MSPYVFRLEPPDRGRSGGSRIGFVGSAVTGAEAPGALFGSLVALAGLAGALHGIRGSLQLGIVPLEGVPETPQPTPFLRRLLVPGRLAESRVGLISLYLIAVGIHLVTIRPLPVGIRGRLVAVRGCLIGLRGGLVSHEPAIVPPSPDDLLCATRTLVGAGLVVSTFRLPPRGQGQQLRAEIERLRLLVVLAAAGRVNSLRGQLALNHRCPNPDQMTRRRTSPPIPRASGPRRVAPGPSAAPVDEAPAHADGTHLPPSWYLAAIEHAADAIVVVDLDGTIRYVNPAFERDTGLGRDYLIGQNVRTLPTGEQPAARIRSLWAAIRRGDVWTGELVNRRPDGTLAHAEATVAPIRDAAGAIVGGVSVRRDITRQRALETRLDEYHRERAALAAVLAAMRSGDTAEATAEAIGLALLGLSGFGGVGIFGFEPSGDIAPLVALVADGRSVSLPGSLSPERSAYHRERASHGPWIEEWNPGPDHPYYALGVEHDVRTLAYVPIRSDGDTVALLVVSAADSDTLALSERLPALVECAAFAGALLGPQLRSRSAGALSETRVRAIITARTFLPVFQPIVDLASRVVVGYEGLTRFADGSRPDEVFAEATRCGLAIELEAATLEAILDASAALPASAWLNLNVSAEFVLAGEPLASILRGWGGQIVLELTEHTEVTDYPGLRAALERLGPDVRLAVDDAGAGFASLRHILELQPDYVKLDRGIVRQIHRDPARQALVAGMVHFAGKTGAILVGEGVETDPEAYELQRLGVALAQGYRLGRPALASRMAPLAGRASPTLVAPMRSPRRRARSTVRKGDIGATLNIGPTVAAALREAGIANVADLRTLGAMAAWERLRQLQPGIATARTLLQLEGGARGIRVGELSAAERARLRLFVKLGS